MQRFTKLRFPSAAFLAEQPCRALPVIIGLSNQWEIAMTSIPRTSATRLALAAGFAAVNLLAVVSNADAASLRVQMACASDYFAYCSQHPSDGPKVRQCMRTNGHKLSTSCINALISAGEVSKAEVARRAARAN